MNLTQFDFVRHKIFGWYIHQKILKADDVYTLYSPKDTPQTESGNITFYTKGLIKGTHKETNSSVRDRIPGMFSLDYVFIQEGNFEFRVIQDSEWWCINYIANRKSLPIVSKFVLEQGKFEIIPNNSNLFIARGKFEINNKEMEGPLPLKITSSDIKFNAKSDCYGLYFEKERIS